MKDNWSGYQKAIEIDILKESGSGIDNKQDIANILSEYFCSVCKDLATRIQTVPNSIMTKKYNLNPHNMQFNFKARGVQDIREALIKIKTSKSFGSYKISSCFSKLAIPLMRGR